LAAWDVHRAKVFGRCESQNGMAPVGEVMGQEPYNSARRVFGIMDNAPRMCPAALRQTSEADRRWDRLLWAWLCSAWNGWESGLSIVKAATVVGWHRHAFRLFWYWKTRRGKACRPSVPCEVRELIGTMSRENPRWGAPRIHGELLKLGIDIGQTSVGK